LIGIVIVAHGGLAREYLLALEHVVGRHPGTIAVSIEADDVRAEKLDEIRAAIDEVDQGHGVAIVTDIFGGTPSNLAMAACGRDDRTILYGANLPMLIKLAKARQSGLREAVHSALEAGRKYISCSDNLAVLPAQARA
jgi:PTS system mannose-specific IIA component